MSERDKSKHPKHDHNGDLEPVLPEPYWPPDPNGLNLTVVGPSPAVAMANLYINTSQAASTAALQAAQNQQLVNILGLVVTTCSAFKLLDGRPKRRSVGGNLLDLELELGDA